MGSGRSQVNYVETLCALRWKGVMMAKEKIEESGMDLNRSKEMAKIAIAALEDKKGEEIRVLDISEVTVVADYFIIAGGNSRAQMQALCENVQEKMGRAGYPERHVEGYDNANWILMDFGDIIVHLFDKENRATYDLERIWRDGKSMDGSEFQ